MTIPGKEPGRHLLLRPAFLPAAMQRQRRPEITAESHDAFGDFEAGLCSGARVRRPTKESDECTLLLGLMALTTTARDVCCSPWPDGRGGSDPPQQPGSSRPLPWCAVLTGREAELAKPLPFFSLFLSPPTHVSDRQHYLWHASLWLLHE